MSTSRLRGLLRETFLWLTGLLGALCLLGVLAGWLLAITPVVLTSGSMSPTYDTGSVVLTHRVDAADLRAGEVASVVDEAGHRVTHRVVTVAPAADGALLTLRGDANEGIDPTVYRVASADRVLLGVPLLGYALAAAATPIGLLVLLGVVVGALRLGLADTGRPGGRRRGAIAASLGTAVALAAVLGATGNVGWAMSSAYWTTTVTASTTASTAVPAPVASCSVTGTNGNFRIRLTWTYATDPATRFEVRGTATSGSVSTLGLTATVPKTLRTWDSPAFSSVSGQIWVVAVESNGAEVESNRIAFAFGSGAGGGNKLCPSP